MQLIDAPNGRSVTVPAIDYTQVTAEIVAQGSTPVHRNIPVASKVAVAGYTFRSTNVPVTMELEQDVFESVQEMLSEVFSAAIARGVGNALVNGNGTTAPQGIVTGGTAGPTSAATTLAGDDIEDLYFSVDKAYRPGASFLMNDATYLKVRKLKDSSGRPLLSILNDQEMLLGKPLLICPSLVDVSAGAVAPIMFGDMRQFVVKRSPFVVQRRSEAAGYVEYGTVLIHASQRVDSKVLVPSAISYLTVHA